MRAREFIINVPITIKINGDGDPEINMNDVDDEEVNNPKTFVPPLQQKIELMKHAAGKESRIIDQIVSGDDPDAS